MDWVEGQTLNDFISDNKNEDIYSDIDEMLNSTLKNE